MTILRLTLLVLLVPAVAHAVSARVLNVLTYGASPDGKTLATVAIQRAIDEAASTGGTVLLPSGTFLSGSLFVKTGVTLRIDAGATLLGSHNLADYPLRPTRVAGIEMSWPAALVNVYEQDHAAITGDGTIDGDGKVFWDSYWTLRKSYDPRGLRWAADYDAQRPRLIQIYKSSNSILSGLHLRRSGFWTVHICYSEHVTVEGVTIRNNDDGHGPSTDGIDIDSSRHILVQRADIAVNDDALCLKAGRDSDGLRVNRPTEDVILRDSVIRAGAAGVTFGSETSGGFRNIEASGITVLAPVPVGILFKSAHTRGGFAEDIRLHDFKLQGVAVALRVTLNWNPSYSYATIPAGVTGYPAYWNVLSTPVPEAQGIARVHDVSIARMSGTAKTAFEVDAFAGYPLERFRLDGIDLQVQTAGHIANVRDWTFRNLTLHVADGTAVTLSDASGVAGLRRAVTPQDKP